jgi:serine/threonine-protein kinase
LFLNEAKIAGRLTHPNIVQVLDVGEVGGELYLAMEYVHGKDLREVVRQLQKQAIRMPLGDACFIVREVAKALHHAYSSTDLEGNQMSVVHRDVSPHNVILGYDGTVKLLDFGVAMSSVTEQEAIIVGKWMYMSPEATTNQSLDHRSDLFSLGVITYLLVTGAMPFSGSDSKHIVATIRAGQFKPVLEHAPEVPERLAKLIARMIASAPSERPQTGNEIVGELSEIMRETQIEGTPGDLAYMLATLFPEAQPDGPFVEIPADWRDSSPSFKRRSASFSLSKSPSPLATRRTPSTLSAYERTATGDQTTIDPPRAERTPFPVGPNPLLTNVTPDVDVRLTSTTPIKVILSVIGILLVLALYAVARC